MINQLKNNIGSALVFIIGIILAMIGLTLTLSQINTFDQINKLSEQYSLKSSGDYIVQFDGKETLDKILAAAEKSVGSSSILFYDFLLNYDNTSQLAHLVYISGDNQPVLGLPLIEGREMNHDDFAANNPVVLVGEKRGYKTRDVLQIGSTDYEVIGLTGVKDLDLPKYTHAIYLSAINLPDEVYNSISMDGKIKFSLYNPTPEFTTSFLNELDKSGIETIVTEPPKPFAINQHSYLDVFTNIFFIYIISTLNMLNISIFWVNRRKKEIGIRKAFGYSNADIFILFIKEMSLIISTCVVLVVVLLFALSPVLEYFTGRRIVYGYSNILLSIIFIIITTLLSVFIPIIIASKVEPAEMVKG